VEDLMEELTNQDILSLAKSVDMDIPDDDLDQVAMSLNAILQLMSDIYVDDVNLIEPLPIRHVMEDHIYD
jgi:Asp-tRNA(Asn)/Glu-tRNA(Gln) amidotransferase C subunit|tara:strand:- start:121 stop:330 length:210 start_codon:yes stop_codon:yes gene_type:complete